MKTIALLLLACASCWPVLAANHEAGSLTQADNIQTPSKQQPKEGWRSINLGISCNLSIPKGLISVEELFNANTFTPPSSEITNLFNKLKDNKNDHPSIETTTAILSKFYKDIHIILPTEHFFKVYSGEETETYSFSIRAETIDNPDISQQSCELMGEKELAQLSSIFKKQSADESQAIGYQIHHFYSVEKITLNNQLCFKWSYSWSQPGIDRLAMSTFIIHPSNGKLDKVSLVYGINPKDQHTEEINDIINSIEFAKDDQTRQEQQENRQTIHIENTCAFSAPKELISTGELIKAVIDSTSNNEITKWLKEEKIDKKISAQQLKNLFPEFGTNNHLYHTTGYLKKTFGEQIDDDCYFSIMVQTIANPGTSQQKWQNFTASDMAGFSAACQKAASQETEQLGFKLCSFSSPEKIYLNGELCFKWSYTRTSPGIHPTISTFILHPATGKAHKISFICRLNPDSKYPQMVDGIIRSIQFASDEDEK